MNTPIHHEMKCESAARPVRLGQQICGFFSTVPARARQLYRDVSEVVFPVRAVFELERKKEGVGVLRFPLARVYKVIFGMEHFAVIRPPVSIAALKKLLNALDDLPCGRDPYFVLKMMTTGNVAAKDGPLLSQSGLGNAVMQRRKNLLHYFDKNTLYEAAFAHFTQLSQRDSEQLEKNIFATVVTIFAQQLFKVDAISPEDIAVIDRIAQYFDSPLQSHLFKNFAYFDREVWALQKSYRALVAKLSQHVVMDDESIVSLLIAANSLAKLLRNAYKTLDTSPYQLFALMKEFLDNQAEISNSHSFEKEKFPALHAFYQNLLSRGLPQPEIMRDTDREIRVQHANEPEIVIPANCKTNFNYSEEQQAMMMICLDLLRRQGPGELELAANIILALLKVPKEFLPANVSSFDPVILHALFKHATADRKTQTIVLHKKVIFNNRTSTISLVNLLAALPQQAIDVKSATNPHYARIMESIQFRNGISRDQIEFVAAVLTQILMTGEPRKVFDRFCPPSKQQLELFQQCFLKELEVSLGEPSYCTGIDSTPNGCLAIALKSAGIISYYPKRFYIFISGRTILDDGEISMEMYGKKYTQDKLFQTYLQPLQSQPAKDKPDERFKLFQSVSLGERVEVKDGDVAMTSANPVVKAAAAKVKQAQTEDSDEMCDGAPSASGRPCAR